MSDLTQTQKNMTELDWAPNTKLVFQFFDSSLNTDSGVIKI